VDYGEKCRREFCREETVFSRLGTSERKFWLHLADGLDSFSYSSRKVNALFNMINWGATLLDLIAIKEKDSIIARESFFQRYPFFSTTVSPRANAYLLDELLRKGMVEVLKSRSFRTEFEKFSRALAGEIHSFSSARPDAPHVHRLDLNGNFLDFLRLSARIKKMHREEALILKEEVDDRLDRFRRKFD